MERLPLELWRLVFDFATNDETILQPIFSSSMEQCEWHKLVYGDWTLRTPEQRIRVQQRQSYATKKAIVRTCRAWRQIGAEFMFRDILITDARQLQRLCEILDRGKGLGWRTTRIHVSQPFRRTLDDLDMFRWEDGLASVIRHCPNLETFIVDPLLENAFLGIIAETLCTYCSPALRALRWHVTCNDQSKTILAVDSLQNLVSLQLSFSSASYGKLAGPHNSDDKTLSGAGSLLDITLPHLRDLGLHGSIQDLVEQVSAWHIPELTSLVIDFGSNCHDFPDILEFLSTLGPQLISLDLYSLPPLDVPNILAICPSLTSFSFNLDWALHGVLVNLPHQNIERIGLYGLQHAFGVGCAAAIASIKPLHASVLRRYNDENFVALNRRDFPKLRIVRVLDPVLLSDLNRENGPAEGPCYQRWDKWWEQCSAQRIRLEDCTGALLGTLPEHLVCSDTGSTSEQEEEEEEVRSTKDCDERIDRFVQTRMQALGIY